MKGLRSIKIYDDVYSSVPWHSTPELFDFLPNISANDADLIDRLYIVGEGEFRGLAIQSMAYRLADDMPNCDLEPLNECYIFLTKLIYDELRHGTTLFTLYSRDENFVRDSLDSQIVSSHMWKCKNVWDNPYELFASALIGEIINTMLYKKAAEKAEHPQLKKIFRYIMKDEARHLYTWTEIIKRSCAEFSISRKRFTSAIEHSITTHQAAVGYNFKEGMDGTEILFSESDRRQIALQTCDVVMKVLGEPAPFTTIDILKMLRNKTHA